MSDNSASSSLVEEVKIQPAAAQLDKLDMEAEEEAPSPLAGAEDDEDDVLNVLLVDDEEDKADLPDAGDVDMQEPENKPEPTANGANAAAEEEDEDDPIQFLLSLGAQPLASLAPKLPTPPPPDSDDDALPTISDEAKGSNVEIGHLYQVCARVWGNHEPLKWDYGVDGGLGLEKKATLTIELPNGNKRVFKSRGHWTKKSQAKASAAAVALESGAIDFLSTGADARVRENTSSGDAEAAENQQPLGADEEKILEQCKTWRLDKVRPVFTYTVDPKQGTGFGCVVSIYLTKEHQRSWSVAITYPTRAEAKLAACEVAIRLGILDFIAHGDGLTEPWDEEKAAAYPKNAKELILLGATQENPGQITQQAYFDALPKERIPPNVGFKDGQSNPIGFVHQSLNRVHSRGVLSHFTAVNIAEAHQGHGCLLRVEHGDQSYSYFAPCAFPKRAEAKAAACCLALSQGLAQVLEDIQKSGHGRFPAPSSQFGSTKQPGKPGRGRPGLTMESDEKDLGELCLAAIDSELRHFKPEAAPHFQAQETEGGGYTSRLEVWTDPRDKRTYISPGSYRTKHEAKLALCTAAVKRGILEFVRFRGGPVPLNYVRPPIGGVDIPYDPDMGSSGLAGSGSASHSPVEGRMYGGASRVFHPREAPPARPYDERLPAVYPPEPPRGYQEAYYPPPPPRDYRDERYPPQPPRGYLDERPPAVYDPYRRDAPDYYDYRDHRDPYAQDPRAAYPVQDTRAPYPPSHPSAYPADYDPYRAYPPPSSGYDRYDYRPDYRPEPVDPRYDEYRRRQEYYERYPEARPEPTHPSYTQEADYYPRYNYNSAPTYDSAHPPPDERRSYHDTHAYPPREAADPYRRPEHPDSAYLVDRREDNYSHEQRPGDGLYDQVDRPSYDSGPSPPSPCEASQRKISLEEYLASQEQAVKVEDVPPGTGLSASLNFGRPALDPSQEYSPIGDVTLPHLKQPAPPPDAVTEADRPVAGSTAMALSSAAVAALLASNPFPTLTAGPSKSALSVAIPAPTRSQSTPTSSKSVRFALDTDIEKKRSPTDPKKRQHPEDDELDTPVTPDKAKPFTAALLNLCTSKNLAAPEFRCQSVSTDGGEQYRVWVMVGTQKMELKTTFSSIEEGYERLSKVVKEKLENKQPQAKKRKIKEDSVPPAFPSA